MPQIEENIQFPESLHKFQENWTKKNPGKMPGQYHNVYQLIAEDLNGNIVDEMFGVNCMTDQGFNKAYCTTDWVHSPRIVLGNGEGDIDPTSTTLISYISKTPATTSNETLTFYGQRFYPETGMTVARMRIVVGYYDYTIWSEDKTVTEIGVYSNEGGNADNLMFHAKVYDADGNPSSFVKKVNERLTISVYATISVPIAEICNKAWDKGLYILMNAYSFFKYYHDQWFRYLYTHYDSYHNDNHSGNTWFDISGSSTKIENNIATRQAGTSSGAYYEGKYQYLSEISVSNVNSGDGNWKRYHNSYVTALFKPKLETPLAITTDWFRTNSYYSSSFSSNFGQYTSDHTRSCAGQLPVTDIHFTSLKMYSCQDHDWTIDVPFYEPEKEPAYDIGYLKYSIWDHNYIQFLDKESWFRVYLNERPDVPITSFNRSGLTFYATDAYWDSSTWEIIPNLSSIPTELGTKRYYVTFTDEFPYNSSWEKYGYGTYYTIPVSRQQETHHLVTDTQNFNCNWGWFYRTYPYGDERNVSGKCISNDEYGYVASMNQLIFLESEDPNPDLRPTASITSGKQYPYRYNIYGVNGDVPHRGLIWNTTRGSRIATSGLNSFGVGFRVYTITTDPTVAPTYQDFKFDQTFDTNPHWSYSDNGYVIASYLSGSNNQNTTYVLEYYVQDVEPNMYSVQGYHHCHVIDLTDYFCGVNSNVTDHLSLDIYDMRNREVIDTIDIPAGYTFSGMAGWKNFIYIRVYGGSYTTYVYYINEKRLVLTNLDIGQMLIDEYSYYSHIQRAVEAKGNCESCMVMVSSNRDYQNQYHMLFKESDPENPIRLARTGDNDQVSGYVVNQAAQLRYVNDDKQLLLSVSSYRGIVYDIGWALDNGTINTVYTWQYPYGNPGETYVPFIYKKYIGLLLPHEYTFWYGSDIVKATKTTLNLYPYEYWLNFRLEATTKTINSYHNPVRVYGVKGAKFQITNRNINDTSTSE